MVHDYYDESEGKPGNKIFKEFECPDCAAENPYDDGFSIGHEILCYYCGLHYKVIEKDGGFKLKEV